MQISSDAQVTRNEHHPCTSLAQLKAYGLLSPA